MKKFKIRIMSELIAKDISEDGLEEITQTNPYKDDEMYWFCTIFDSLDEVKRFILGQAEDSIKAYEEIEDPSVNISEFDSFHKEWCEKGMTEENFASIMFKLYEITFKEISIKDLM